MDSRVTIVPAQFKHVARIARHMRAVDKLECTAMGRDPKSALRNALMISEKAWTGCVDGKAEAMFGVVVNSALTREAVPWFLGTDEVYRHGRELLMWGPGIIERLRDSRYDLANLVCSQNRQAIRLLKRWGFTVAEDDVIVRGTPFRHFEMAYV